MGILAERLGRTTFEVEAACREKLRGWELIAVGPPSNEQRHDLIDELDREWPRNGNGHRMPGYWKMATARVHAWRRGATL